MRLLIKGAGNTGLAAHIANAHGAPLCRTNIKLSDWYIQERSNPILLICYNCRRVQAKKMPKLDNPYAAPSAVSPA
jgi:hypothetical protein